MADTIGWFDDASHIERDRRCSTSAKARCPLCRRAWRTHYPNVGLLIHLVKLHALPPEEAVRHVDAVAIKKEAQEYGFLLPWTVTV
jgi:hypothetical protein